MSPEFLQPGCAYSFDYPRHNYRQLPSDSEYRKIVVTSIRDTHREPLDQTTVPLNPLLQRGRWLVTGRDLDKDVERSFYLESMNNIRALSDGDLQPLVGVEYVVIEQTHVICATQRLVDALAFQSGHPLGAICAVICHGPREVVFDSIDEFLSATSS